MSAAPVTFGRLWALMLTVFVDMVGRRRVAVVSDLLSMTSVALVPILGARFDLGFAALAALGFLASVTPPGLRYAERTYDALKKLAAEPLESDGIKWSGLDRARALAPVIKDNGYDWNRQMRDLGYEIQHVTL